MDANYDSPDGGYSEKDYNCPYCGDPVDDDGDFCNPHHRFFYESDNEIKEARSFISKSSCHYCGEIVPDKKYFCNTTCRAAFNAVVDDGC